MEEWVPEANFPLFDFFFVFSKSFASSPTEGFSYRFDVLRPLPFLWRFDCDVSVFSGVWAKLHYGGRDPILSLVVLVLFSPRSVTSRLRVFLVDALCSLLLI